MIGISGVTAGGAIRRIAVSIRREVCGIVQRCEGGAATVRQYKSINPPAAPTRLTRWRSAGITRAAVDAYYAKIKGAVAAGRAQRHQVAGLPALCPNPLLRRQLRRASPEQRTGRKRSGHTPFAIYGCITWGLLKSMALRAHQWYANPTTPLSAASISPPTHSLRQQYGLPPSDKTLQVFWPA